MNETTITVVGNLTEDPVLRHTTQGVELLTLRLASNSRRWDRDSGEWVDGESLFLRATCWRQLAQNAAESLRRGDPVVVSGRLYTRQFEVEGERRSIMELEATAIGHDLARGVTSFRRVARGGSASRESASRESAPPEAVPQGAARQVEAPAEVAPAEVGSERAGAVATASPAA